MPHRPKPRSAKFHVAPPPGLDRQSCDHMEKCNDMTIIDVARRVERIELLLFHAPESEFIKLDNHINSILAKGCDEVGDPVDDDVAFDFPATCEVFSIDDDSIMGAGSGYVPGDAGQLSLSSILTESSLAVRLAAVENDMEKLKVGVLESQNYMNEMQCCSELSQRVQTVQSRLDDYETGKAEQSQLVVSAITEIVNRKFDAHEERITMLEEQADKFKQDVARCASIAELLQDAPSKETNKTKKRSGLG